MHSNHHDEKAYEEVFNSSAESILVVNGAGVIIMANPRSETLFGYEHGELINQAIDILIPEKLRSAHHGHLAKYHQKPEPRQMGKGRDLVGRAKDGREFPIEVSLNPASLNDEKVVIAFLIDITDRKKIEKALETSEKQLIKYAAELEKRVTERTQELASTIEKLGETNKKLESEISERKKAEDEARRSLEKEKELNELKSRFVSMASHEFRTPLSTILSSAALISKYIDPDTVEKRLKHIERIKANVHDLTGILNDFLSLDKLEEGGIQNNPTMIDLVEFMNDVVEELSQITKRGQIITFDSSVRNYEFEIDQQILKHIMSNLVSNAVKYSSEEDKIKISLSPNEKSVELSVKDYGVGIPINEQKHLFERFFRAHNVSHIQGTGLGLNLVQKYLTLVGGSIKYKSNEDKGSCFIVTLFKS